MSAAERSGAPVVVLLHAFPLSSEMWAATRHLLGDEARVLAPEFTGFGGTPLAAGEPSLDHYADQVVALLDAEGVDRAVVAGLSMGGYVAMALLRRAPHRVRALVLADTKATADPDAAREKRLQMAGRLEREQTTDALVDEVLPGLLGPTTRATRPEVVDRVAAAVRAASPSGAAWAQRAMAARPDSLADLAGADVPALVMRGEEDELATAVDAASMVAALPLAQLCELTGAGHLSVLEVPGAFNASLREFVLELA